MKCSICKGNVETTFLGKLEGTRMRVGKKEHIICQACQKRHKTKEELLSKLPR